MKDNEKNRKQTKRAEIHQDMECLIGNKQVKQDQDAQTLGSLKKAWVKINQDNILKQIALQ